MWTQSTGLLYSQATLHCLSSPALLLHQPYAADSRPNGFAALVAFCVWLCQDAYECCLLNVTAAVEQGGNHYDLIVFKFSAAEQVTSCLLLLINNKLLLAGHNPCHQLLP